MTAFLELDGVSRVFGQADSGGIRDISLTINHGEYVAIVGPSGAGKSTLLNILGLLDLPDSGTYRVNGRATSQLRERERDEIRSTQFGFIFQESHVIDHVKTINNAAMGLRQRDLPAEQIGALAFESLEKFGVSHRAYAEAGTLSGGERQRLAIARAVAPDPALILADEPTGSLDTKNGLRVLQDLDALHQNGTTIIVVTHDAKVAERAGRVVTIVDGKVSSDVQQREDALPKPRSVRAVPAAEKPWRQRMLDTLGEAFTEVLHKRLRTVLLSLAFALGIGGLVMAVGLSQTASHQITERLSAAALDEVRVNVPGGGSLLGPQRAVLQKWIAQLRALPHVQNVGMVALVPTSEAQLRRLSDDEPEPERHVQLLAADEGFMQIMGLEMKNPVALKLLQEPEVRGVAVIGEDAAETLGVPDGEGARIRVINGPASVLGQFRATQARGKVYEAAVVVSAATLSHLPNVSVQLVIHTEQGFPAAVAEAAPLTLDPVNPGKFTTETVADLRQLRYGVSTDLDSFVAVMSGILLILAVVSASTTMYLSVQARASEIALRRALGFRRSSIASLFLSEGLLLGVLGGAVGVLVGASGVLLIAHQQGWDPVMDVLLIPSGIVLGTVTGLVSAIVPALVAARQEPAGQL